MPQQTSSTLPGSNNIVVGPQDVNEYRPSTALYAIPNASSNATGSLSKALRDIVAKYHTLSGFDIVARDIEISQQQSVQEPQQSLLLTKLSECIRTGVFAVSNKPTPYCTTCATTCPQHNLISYTSAAPSCIVFFPTTSRSQIVLQELLHQRGVVADSCSIGVLVHTVSPWSLPMNQAVAISPQTTYTVAKYGGRLCLFGTNTYEFIRKQLPNTTDDEELRVLLELPAADLCLDLCLISPISNTEVPLICDTMVDVNKGTACVHIAPQCSVIDYEVGQRHNLRSTCTIQSTEESIGEVVDVLRSVYTIHPKVAEIGSIAGDIIATGNEVISTQLKNRGDLWQCGEAPHPAYKCGTCKSTMVYRPTPNLFVQCLPNKEMFDTAEFIPPKLKQRFSTTIKPEVELACISQQHPLHETSRKFPEISVRFCVTCCKGSASVVGCPEIPDICCHEIVETTCVLQDWAEQVITDECLGVNSTQQEIFVQDKSQLQFLPQFLSLKRAISPKSATTRSVIVAHGEFIGDDVAKWTQIRSDECRSDVLSLAFACINISAVDAGQLSDFSINIEKANKDYTDLRDALEMLRKIVPNKPVVDLDYSTLPLVDQYMLTLYNDAISRVHKNYVGWNFPMVLSAVSEFIRTDLQKYLIRVKTRTDPTSVQFVLSTVLVGLLQSVAPIVPAVAQEIYAQIFKQNIFNTVLGPSIEIWDRPDESKTRSKKKTDLKVDMSLRAQWATLEEVYKVVHKTLQGKLVVGDGCVQVNVQSSAKQAPVLVALVSSQESSFLSDMLGIDKCVVLNLVQSSSDEKGKQRGLWVSVELL